jgi:hypothetical protein
MTFWKFWSKIVILIIDSFENRSYIFEKILSKLSKYRSMLGIKFTYLRNIQKLDGFQMRRDEILNINYCFRSSKSIHRISNSWKPCIFVKFNGFRYFCWVRQIFKQKYTQKGRTLWWTLLEFLAILHSKYFTLTSTQNWIKSIQNFV